MKRQRDEKIKENRFLLGIYLYIQGLRKTGARCALA
jgi:hypothetical protein